MHLDPHRPQPRPHEAMLPAIHLMAFLLIVVMVVSGSWGMHGPKLPTARTALPAMQDRLTVWIDRNGMIGIASDPDPGPVPDPQLAQRLRDAYAGRQGEELYLVADRNAEFVAVQQVIGAARQAGVREVQLIVACPRGGESLTRHCRT